MDILNNINEIGNKISDALNLEELQNKFINSEIGKITNYAIDFGLKTILPDYMENEVIEIKDAFIQGGIKEGVNSAVENAIDVGKNILGISDVEFKNINDVKDVLQQGEVTEKLANTIENVVDVLEKTNIIPENVADLIKEGKNIFFDSLDNNLNKEMSNQIESVEKIEKYINNWEKYYNDKNIEKLNKKYNKIEKQMNKIMPLKNILENVKKIQNINELIKNNDNFNFDKVYLDLAKNI